MYLFCLKFENVKIKATVDYKIIYIHEIIPNSNQEPHGKSRGNNIGSKYKIGRVTACNHWPACSTKGTFQIYTNKYKRFQITDSIAIQFSNFSAFTKKQEQCVFRKVLRNNIQQKFTTKDSKQTLLTPLVPIISISSSSA